MEEWKVIKDYPNYMVSNMGQVKSLNYNHTGIEKIMKPSVSKRGYLLICLRKNRKVKYFKVHRLVAQAFIPNPNDLPQVNHKNEIKDDNKVENLEWCDAKYNSNYGTRNKRVVEAKKGIKLSEETKNKISEAKSKPVLQIDKNTNEVIAEYPSLREVERQLGINNSNVSRCCNNKPHHNTAYGFKWKYKEESVA